MNKSVKSKNKIKFTAFTLVFIILLSQIMQIYMASAADYNNGELDFCIAVDYYTEKIYIINPNSMLGSYGDNHYIEIADNSSVIDGSSSVTGKSDLAKNISVAKDGEYMYALKAVSDEVLDSYVAKNKPERKISALMKEKWYPIYGGGFDIKSAIPAKAPKDSKKQYYIAIRKADDYFDTETGYKTRITVPIKPRYNERTFNKFIEYDEINEKIVLSSLYTESDYVDIIYRYDYFDSITGKLAKDNTYVGGSIDVPGKLFSSGGYVYISSLPFVINGPYGPTVSFARSKEIKFKIPKIPAMPTIKADNKIMKITSIKKNALEWSLTGGDSPDSWQPYTKTSSTLYYTDVLNTFYGISDNNIDLNGNYVIYFRIKAIDKRSPASLPKKILIPAELCY